MVVRKMQDQRGWAFNLAVVILKPLLLALTKRSWSHGERIPESGGCVVVLNHLSHLDPLTAAHFVHDHGRAPRYLAKAALFHNPVLGAIMRGAGQIPVERESRNAMGAYDAAVAAVREGQCVVVYPEATITRDPDLWPMRGKTGAARIALATGCPVIPVGQWGAQEILPPYTTRPHLFPRKRVTMRAGEPVVLADLAARERTPEVTAEATERIMAAITAEVAEIRGEPAPAERYDMRIHGDRFKKRKGLPGQEER
ncbi:1-acyl-sn-glycerol-3-phosphate acyltransferase [Nocardioides panacisoli]|uniref:lysophospholipid acyltransferase family protein n=1 Tax=Nocardioides panacisoli TaxID=627624 RepID=UPI001C639104|nr:lysophospholipid acyltransferase family protein [Nocardioides panacisoli]QYJ04545.1 1-acyl-sn-glycerol-3-phosphate acyltransferase [Nocardioides panacisoli]